jgi:hypothetical protein
VNGVSNDALQNPAPKIVRAVYSTLEDHFDDGARRYHTGWDDAKVAAHVGTSPQIVKALREEAFGKLAEDPRLGPLREDIELQRMLIEDFLKESTRKLNDLARRVDQVTVQVSA